MLFNFQEIQKAIAIRQAAALCHLPASRISCLQDRCEWKAALIEAARQHRETLVFVFPAQAQEALLSFLKDALTIPALLAELIHHIHYSVLVLPGGLFQAANVHLQYLCSLSEHLNMQQEMAQALTSATAEIQADAGPGAPSWKRAYALARYAVRHWDYLETGIPLQFTPGQVLCRHSGVCMGIALAACLLARRLALPCRYVTGQRCADSTAGHAWNLIYVTCAGQSGWFHIDLTDAITQRDPLAFWGITDLAPTGRTLDSSFRLPEPLFCPCPAAFLRRQTLRLP